MANNFWKTLLRTRQKPEKASYTGDSESRFEEKDRIKYHCIILKYPSYRAKFVLCVKIYAVDKMNVFLPHLPLNLRQRLFDTFSLLPYPDQW